MRINREALLRLPESQRAEAERMLKAAAEIRLSNPLDGWEPNSGPQREFMASRTPITAAIAGNRAGKTTGLVVRALVDLVDEQFLPRHLREFKRWPGPTFGRLVCPDFTATAEGVILPALRRWGPMDAFKGGSFDAGWDKQLRTLRFANGSWLQVMTYEQSLDKFGGAGLHFVAYDEPPPKEIREECMARLLDFGGYEMFAFTPLKANTGYLRREIFKKRESPDVTVVRSSIHDNKTLDPDAKKRFLEGLSSDLWRRAREFGDFVDLGGLIYEEFERIVVEPQPASFVQKLDHLVGIDPGIRNCGITFAGFDSQGVAWVYDEALIQDGTPADYVKAIHQRLAKWGVPMKGVLFVIDPAARQRGQVTGETVQSELARLGVFTMNGQNDVEAGIQQVRQRVQHKRIHVFRSCVGLRDEADEYAAEDRPDGEFKPIKGNDHRLDSLRYLCMARPWYPQMEAHAPERNLGWEPGAVPDLSKLAAPASGAPLGFMS